jgi:peptide deformylase
MTSIGSTRSTARRAAAHRRRTSWVSSARRVIIERLVKAHPHESALVRSQAEPTVAEDRDMHAPTDQPACAIRTTRLRPGSLPRTILHVNRSRGIAPGDHRRIAHRSDVAPQLTAFLYPLHAAHSFGKGIGLAAPQIGVNRCAAVVQAPDQPSLVLYNPRIVDASRDTDEQYEGCLSFFDVRGTVRRPLRIDVEHTDLDGITHITRFQRAAARLWAHEIDHLQDKLYTDRMPPGVNPVPVECYHGTGTSWRYDPSAA